MEETTKQVRITYTFHIADSMYTLCKRRVVLTRLQWHLSASIVAITECVCKCILCTLILFPTVENLQQEEPNGIGIHYLCYCMLLPKGGYILKAKNVPGAYTSEHTN